MYAAKKAHGIAGTSFKDFSVILLLFLLLLGH